MELEQLYFDFMEEEHPLSLPSNDNQASGIPLELEELDPLYLKLHTQPCSAKAEIMVSALAAKIHAVIGIPERPNKKFAFAVGATVSDLLKAQAASPSRHCQRHMSAGSFTGCKVGYRPFLRLLNLMEESGLVEVEKGQWFRRSADGAGKLTAIRATSNLLRFAMTHGITPSNSGDHFKPLPRPKAIPAPVKLSRERIWIRGIKQPKSMMVIDHRDMKAQELAVQVNRLNAYFAEQDIAPDRHHAFERRFHNGDVCGFDWNKGGRIYSVGESFQHMKPEERATTLINGESTVEIDIGASHVRCFYGLSGQPLDPAVDPYSMAAFPREVVKDFVTMTLGHHKFQRAWSPRKKEEYAERGIDLQKSYPITKVRKAVLDHLSLLKGWEQSPMRWDDLQYVESRVIIECMEILAFVHDVPALPVHDSIIIPAGHKALAMDVLSRCFEKHTGAVPMLKVKGVGQACL